MSIFEIDLMGESGPEFVIPEKMRKSENMIAQVFGEFPKGLEKAAMLGGNFAGYGMTIIANVGTSTKKTSDNLKKAIERVERKPKGKIRFLTNREYMERHPLYNGTIDHHLKKMENRVLISCSSAYHLEKLGDCRLFDKPGKCEGCLNELAVKDGRYIVVIERSKDGNS